MLVAATVAGCNLLDRYANANEIVYLIEHGDRYHDAECPYVDEEATEVSLSYAIARHYTPDPICSPPRLEERMSNRSLSIALFVVGGFGTAFLVLGVPSLIQRRNTRVKATDIARARSGESWDTLSRKEQKRLIRDTVSRLNEPSTGNHREENSNYLD